MGLFHFVRLALDWDLIIMRGEEMYNIHTLGSAVYFLFSIVVVYAIVRARREDKRVDVGIEEEDEEKFNEED